MQNFAERLDVAIAKSGKPKGGLADHCGVALSTVSRWLAGSVPKAEMLQSIAQFLGVDAKWLLLGDQEEDLPGLSSRGEEDPAEYKVSKPAVEIEMLGFRLDRVESTLERIVTAVERIAIALEALKDKRD